MIQLENVSGNFFNMFIYFLSHLQYQWFTVAETLEVADILFAHCVLSHLINIKASLQHDD